MLLKVEGLCKKYSKFSLEKISFGIPKGYIMGFVGQNGAGKSTTIKCIIDLIPYESGNIQVAGLDSKRNSVEVKQHIGYVSEEQYFYEEMTAEWTGGFIGGFYSNWDKAYFDKLLCDFNIDRKKKIRELSKGMKTKLSLALAFAHRPQLLILDEPTSGLDPVARSELLEILSDMLQNGDCSILFSSHITSDIEKIADYVTIINKGKIILSEQKDDILNNWKVIKAENGLYSEEVCKGLIGIKKGELGFSGITDKVEHFSEQFRRINPKGKFKTEKVNLDELLVRLVKEGEYGA
ncbi:ABC transporter ATP-binding protein [Anaerobacterium chartisolvens]|nr:ABC transporter ATP-binding protein [Anaerobacterium chartisolvens]